MSEPRTWTLVADKTNEKTIIIHCKQAPWLDVRDPEEHYARVTNEALKQLFTHAGAKIGDTVEWEYNW